MPAKHSSHVVWPGRKGLLNCIVLVMRSPVLVQKPFLSTTCLPPSTCRHTSCSCQPSCTTQLAPPSLCLISMVRSALAEASTRIGTTAEQSSICCIASFQGFAKLLTAQAQPCAPAWTIVSCGTSFCTTHAEVYPVTLNFQLL